MSTEGFRKRHKKGLPPKLLLSTRRLSGGSGRSPNRYTRPSDGRTLTLAEWAAELSVTRGALYERVRDWRQGKRTLEEILSEHRLHSHGIYPAPKVTRPSDGRTLTRREWARELGLHLGTIHHRLYMVRNGKRSLDEVLSQRVLPVSPEQRRDRMLTFNGETLSVTGWARRLGCQADSLHQRLHRGWDVERLLTTPIQVKHRRRTAGRKR
jgi:hypothetical protein